MCNKGVITSEMFFADNTKVRAARGRGVSLPPDVSTGQCAGLFLDSSS